MRQSARPGLGATSAPPGTTVVLKGNEVSMHAIVLDRLGAALEWTELAD
jgi:hypothetical protein